MLTIILCVNYIHSYHYQLPAAIAKAGIVFNVSVCLSVSRNQTEVLETRIVVIRGVSHHVSGCDYFGRCLYVCSASSATLQPLE